MTGPRQGEGRRRCAGPERRPDIRPRRAGGAATRHTRLFRNRGIAAPPARRSLRGRMSRCAARGPARAAGAWGSPREALNPRRGRESPGPGRTPRAAAERWGGRRMTGHGKRTTQPRPAPRPARRRPPAPGPRRPAGARSRSGPRAHQSGPPLLKKCYANPQFVRFFFPPCFLDKPVRPAPVP